MVIMGRRENRRYSKKTNFTKGYNIHEVVECHDYLCPDGTRYTVHRRGSMEYISIILALVLILVA